MPTYYCIERSEPGNNPVRLGSSRCVVGRWGPTLHDHWTETMPTIGSGAQCCMIIGQRYCPLLEVGRNAAWPLDRNNAHGWRWGATLHGHWTETMPSCPGHREQMHVNNTESYSTCTQFRRSSKINEKRFGELYSCMKFSDLPV